MVDEAGKAQATKPFQALSIACRKNDLAKVERILTVLQSSGDFAMVSGRDNPVVPANHALQPPVKALAGGNCRTTGR